VFFVFRKTTVNEFSSLNLAAPIAKALTAEGYTTPTPIQCQAIPHVLAGRDILGIAQTGTGKTAAFALPILDQLISTPKGRPQRGSRVLVLAPTRELAGQIADSFRTYGKFIQLSVATVFGGVSINKQINQMKSGTDVLVATPGRLIDLIDRGAISLRQVEILVLDEADQMLDLGFIHALRKIVPMLPDERQTLFFSATMPKAISELSKKFLTNPARVSVAPAASTVERVEQRVVFVNQGDKQALLTITLREPSVERALVFTRTKHGADRVVRHLGGAGIEAAAIHGNKSQAQRERALKAFRDGKTRVLVATDIAARGIDVEGVTHVINFEIPNVPEQYVHRIGRTARAGAAGLAISFVASDEKPFLRDIEKLTRMKAPVAQLPDDFKAESSKINALRPAPRKTGPSGRAGAKRRHPRNGSGGAGRPGGVGRPGGAGPKRSGKNRQGQGQGRGRGR